MTFHRFSSGITLSVHLRGIQKVFFSTHIDGHHAILVRDFIHSALYAPNHGYFSKRSGPVGVMESSIKFNRLEGRKAYLRYLEKIYKQSEISWFTPVELFKPWYAYGIAEAIMRTANLSVPLQIYEIGGGSGTCAKGIMDYVMLNAPSRVYNNMTYMWVSYVFLLFMFVALVRTIGLYAILMNRVLDYGELVLCSPSVN
ncbi:hypothetical protein Cgig2_018948 [Carnegiea gigantea]|uniref:Protein arginine methyltransferase NDUFAF7 n=1 Tax=Carnegiea gigantea TaxID=171969 RepID=A0A9Q1JLV1_9CARY|nr:hypothetical protein Cgig2_018948 [Carnegiea gigantea]